MLHSHSMLESMYHLKLLSTIVNSCSGINIVILVIYLLIAVSIIEYLLLRLQKRAKCVYSPKWTAYSINFIRDIEISP